MTMNKEQVKVGLRVKSNVDFSGVPKGTHGIIDALYEEGGGCFVAWDLPDRPLPADYTKWNEKSAITPGQPLRDGFAWDELKFLDVVTTIAPQDLYDVFAEWRTIRSGDRTQRFGQYAMNKLLTTETYPDIFYETDERKAYQRICEVFVKG
jgi:hypothetical protein